MSESLSARFKKYLMEKVPVRVRPHRVIEEFKRPPMFSVGLENLYGVPVYDVLDGYKGQIIGVDILANYTDQRHRLPIMAVKFKLGYTMLFARARLRRGKGEVGAYSYPIIVNGVATPYIDLLKRPDLRFYFYEYKMETGEFTVALDDILNLEQVMEGSAPVLVTDKYGVRSVDKVKEANRLLELSKLVEQLTTELQKVQVKVEEERRNANMALNMAEYYRRQLSEASERIEKLSKEYYSIRDEFEKTLASLRSRISELELATMSGDRFKSLAMAYLDDVQAIAARITRLGEIFKEAGRALEVKEAEAAGGGKA